MGATAISPRKRQVVALLAEGRSNKEIARALGIEPATVKTHVMQLFAYWEPPTAPKPRSGREQRG